MSLAYSLCINETLTHTKARTVSKTSLNPYTYMKAAISIQPFTLQMANAVNALLFRPSHTPLNHTIQSIRSFKQCAS